MNVVLTYLKALRDLPTTLSKKANRTDLTALASVVEGRLAALDERVIDISDIVRRAGLKDLNTTLSAIERKAGK